MMRIRDNIIITIILVLTAILGWLIGNQILCQALTYLLLLMCCGWLSYFSICAGRAIDKKLQEPSKRKSWGN